MNVSERVLHAALAAFQPGFRDVPPDVQAALTHAVESAWRAAALTGDYSLVGEALTDLHEIIGEELDETALDVGKDRRSG